MNTSHNNEWNNPDFDHLFTHSNEKDELLSDARLLSFRFLSELERYSDQSKGLKKRLAGLIGTSASYITQLFNGDKIINLETVAKFQKALGIKFKIVAYKEEEFDLFCRFKEPVINVFNTVPLFTGDGGVNFTSSDKFTASSCQIIEKSAILES
jgi:hypothetical protein